MKLSIPLTDLTDYTSRQLNTFFPTGLEVKRDDLLAVTKATINRLEYCFKHINIKYFNDGTQPIFNHLNGDQYSMYLYWMSFLAYKDFERPEVASKIYLLNKALHGIDAYYEVNLPDIFLFIHPLGTVLGRASYQDYLIVYQRCGVGTNKGLYPRLGKYLTLHPGASILGSSETGSNCAIASDSTLIDQTLRSNKTYIGNPKTFVIRERTSFNQVWSF
jgi:serine O-acetyltransferase